MPRKAIVAGVFLSGLLLAGCEWCGNCKGTAGKGALGSSYASTPVRNAGSTASNPIIYNQTPSAQAATPSGNRFATAGTADPKSGLVPASGTASDPSWARKPSESWGGSSGVIPAGGQGPRTTTPMSEVPAPEEPEANNRPLDLGPSLQRPGRPASTSSPGTRPDYP